MPTLTFGTLAGMMIADRLAGQANPWTDLFDPGRKAIRHGLVDCKPSHESGYRTGLRRPRLGAMNGVDQGLFTLAGRISFTA
jgi:hypothetical protein